MARLKDKKQTVETRIKNPRLVREKHLLIANKATKLFIKKGFSDTSMRDISRATRITLGNLYSYIKKKEDVLCLVFELYHKSWIKILEKNGIYDIDDPLEQIRMAVRAMLLKCEDYQDEIKIMYLESRFLPKKVLKIAMENERQLVYEFEKMIRRGIEKGVFQAEDPFFAANMIVFQMSVNPLRGWNLRDKYTYEEVVRYTENFILEALVKK
ncbi:MAG: TetR/AcrR family transcriptional regulator [Deltaproteobacteria bacterium]